jgi:mannitol-specific phosphotransferase system IIBC component
MLDLKVNSHSQHISEFEEEQLATRAVVVNQLCFGCTAGAGSSCGGEIVQLFLPKATLGFYCQWPRN